MNAIAICASADGVTRDAGSSYAAAVRVDAGSAVPQLIAVTESANDSKGDGSRDEWKPPRRARVVAVRTLVDRQGRVALTVRAATRSARCWPLGDRTVLGPALPLATSGRADSRLVRTLARGSARLSRAR